MAVVAFVLGAVVAGCVAYLAARPSGVARAAQELRAQENRRDAAQIVALTDQARRTRDQLLPVLQGLAQELPVDGQRPAQRSDTSTVDGWMRVTSAAVRAFADPPSGQTATNVARGSLAAAVNQLDTAVRTLRLALSPGADPRLFDLARAQRDTAVATWSVGATQLDVVNIDAGHGHQHVFLPAVPGTGAFTADDEPEGSNRR